MAQINDERGVKTRLGASGVTAGLRGSQTGLSARLSKAAPLPDDD